MNYALIAIALFFVSLSLANGSISEITNTEQVLRIAKSSVVVDQFQPVKYLSALNEERFTVLDHPSFPHHKVRVKKSNFCDKTVKFSPVFTSDHF